MIIQKNIKKIIMCLIITVLFISISAIISNPIKAYTSACITFSSPKSGSNYKVGSNVEVKYTVLDPYSDENIQAFVKMNFYADGEKYAEKSMGFVSKGSSVTGSVTLQKMSAGTAKIEIVCIPYNIKTSKLDTSISKSKYPTKTVTFTVGSSTTKDISKCTSKLSKTTYTYNGKSFKPSVTIKDGSKTLKSGTDYTISYASGRKNVGKYKVTIKGKGNYTGTKKLYFTIKPKATTITKVTPTSKAFTVKLKKQTAQTSGYEIQYSTDKNFKKNNKTLAVTKSSTTSKKIAKLLGNKKYYVRVRTYKQASSAKYYSPWSKAKMVTTKK